MRVRLLPPLAAALLAPLAALAQQAGSDQAAPMTPPPPPEVSAKPANLPAGHYRLDPKHASVTARVRHLGVSNYVLRFDRFDADFTWDPAHPETTALQASVDVTSLDVGADYSRKFADEFLNAKVFPQATFTATAMSPAPDRRTGTMTGNLTMMGVTRPVTFDVTFIAVGHGLPFGTIAGFSARTTIHRSDFGSKYVLAYVGDEVSLDIEGEFDRK